MVQEHLDRFYPQAFACAQYRTQKGVSYPTLGGDEGLRDALRAYHLRVHGKHYDHVVITTGAKQALLAGIYALREDDLLTSLYHPTPYWPSYPVLAKLSGLDFFTTDAGALSLRVATAPNNPNGSEIIEARPYILDAA